MIKRLPDMSLKTRLLLMMVSLCFLSILSLTYLYAMAERELVETVQRQAEELSAAIQVSLKEFSKAETDLMKESIAGITGLKRKGIKEISVMNNDREVIASSNPKLIGTRLRSRAESKNITDSITEGMMREPHQKHYDIMLPVVVGKEKLGYLHMAVQFDDLRLLIRANHRQRLFITVSIFALGIGAAIYLSRRYTMPIERLAGAVQKVAEGETSVKIEVAGNDEIARLTRNFNDMIIRLKENRELEARLREAEQMSKIGVFASGIAHEIRNPLNLINLSIDHLKGQCGSSAPDRESFDRVVSSIKSEIKRLDDMVTNFLSYGKPMNLRLEKVSMDAMLRETLDLLEEKLAQQKINLEAKGFNGQVYLNADYRHLKTCLVNILLNAIQSMPGGGNLLIEMFSRKGVVCIRVVDSGAGIMPEHIDKIFEPYFTTKEVGIGLGLALTKRIVEEHGGKISVDSAQGKGTSVTITLPA